MRFFHVIIFLFILMFSLNVHANKEADEKAIKLSVYEYIFHVIENEENNDVEYYFISYNNKNASGGLLHDIQGKSPKAVLLNLVEYPDCTNFDNGGVPEKVKHIKTKKYGAIVNIWPPQRVSNNKYFVEWMYRSKCSSEGGNIAVVEKLNETWVVTSTRKNIEW